jgi:hypothetical protein
MRILHLANHALDVGNGIVNIMVDLAVAQAAAGHEVAIASAECGFGEALTALLRDRAMLDHWRARAATGAAWLRVDRVQREYAEIYGALLSGARQAAHAGTVEVADAAKELVRHD